ncbi:MAG: hypothetical protein ACOC5T_08150 [Elusimicrobiota bacterium]
MSNIINCKEIQLRNFLSFGNKFQSFTPNGLTFITGLNTSNDRRNFTGKTSLLRSFPYSLFGKVEGLSKQRLINWRNKKNLETLITVEKNNTEYKIHRGIKPDFLQVYENGNKLPEPANKIDFQKQIEEEILGIDYDYFMRTIYADINNSSSILTLSKPKKREFLEQVFNLEYYTKLKDAANKKITSIDQQITEKDQEVNYNESRIEDLKSQIKDFEIALDKIKDSTTELNNKKDELEKLNSEYNKNKQEYDELQEKMDTLKKQSERLKLLTSNIDLKLSHIKKNYINKVKDFDIDQKESEYSENIQDLKEKIQKLESEKVDVEYDESEWDRVYNELAEVNANIKQKRKEIEEYESKHDNPPQETICSNCLQPIDEKKYKDQINEILDSLDYKLNSLEEEKDYKKSEFDEIDNKKKQHENNQKIDSEISNLKIELQKLEREYGEIKEKRSLLNKKKKYEKVVDKLDTLKSRISNDKDTIDKQIPEYNDRFDNLKHFFDTHNELLNKIEHLKEKVEQEGKEKERINYWISETNKKVEKLKSDTETEHKNIKKLKNIKDYVKTIKDITADNEVKQYTISNKVPLLNQRVNYYLSKAGVNFYVKLDNWLEAEIRGPGIKDCTYENLSGAERVAIDRSLQFAFNDINKLQSPTHIDLLIMDELLDSSVDSQGIYNIMDIVKTKQKEDNLNVLVVSHRSETTDLDQYFDSKYCIEFDGRFSQVKEL